MSRILVIDDSKLQRTYARLVLEDGGYEVLEAAGGREGLQLVSEQSPDCVLLDLLMPDLSGWEVLQRLKQAGHSVPVVVFTGQDREGCLAQGAAAVVEKAVKPAQLLRAIVSALDGEPHAGNPV